MIKIELTNASNGVLKRIIDTSSSQENSSDITLYEIDEEDILESYLSIITLLTEVSADLGLEMGSDFDSIQLKFDFNWGDKYVPSIEEIDQKIKSLNLSIKQLKELKRSILENGDNV
jgi:hypothetical protein